MLLPMSYGERPPATVSLGCLPAAIFGLIVGGAGVFGSLMGECQDAAGGIGPCPHRRLQIVLIALATGSACLLITWATNRMVHGFVELGRTAAWGVVGGFALAVALTFAIVGLRLAIG